MTVASDYRCVHLDSGTVIGFYEGDEHFVIQTSEDRVTASGYIILTRDEILQMSVVASRLTDEPNNEEEN